MQRNMTTVDGDIKAQMTDGSQKKRSNSGGDKQDLGLKESGDKKDENAEPEDPTGENLTNSMAIEMHDIKCNDGIMKVEIFES